MVAWGILLLLAAAVLRVAIPPASPTVPKAPRAGAAAMRRAVRQSVSRIGGGARKNLWIGQNLNRLGGYPQRWADYALVIQRGGRVVLWGTGVGIWNATSAHPDLSLTVFPVHNPVPLKPVIRPHPLGGGYAAPPATARWMGFSLRSGAVAIAYTPTRVWVYQQQHGVYDSILGPVTFSH
jgi:hypothetical protein